MRRIFAPAAALLLLGACGGAQPTEQEEALPTRAEHPEITANSAAAPNTGMGNPNTATGDPARRDEPGGPAGLQGGQGGTVGQ